MQCQPTGTRLDLVMIGDNMAMMMLMMLLIIIIMIMVTTIVHFSAGAMAPTHLN